MNLVWILMIAMAIIIAIKYYRRLDEVDKTKGGVKKDTFDSKNYELRQSLMTNQEKIFFEKLRKAVGDKYDIYPQVNLDKIFKVKYLQSRNAYKGAKWAIDRRSVDFLVTIRETQRPFIGIELDDNTHEREDRRIRDKKVEELFKNSGINLIRFNSYDNYLEEEIRSIFEVS